MAELKIEDRKAFNFFRSYWNVGKMLPDNERLAFYDAVIKMQFTKEQTELTGMAELAYVSQKHNIDNQINGYEKVGLRIKTVTPNDGASVGAGDGASVQVQVQVQVQDELQLQDKEKEKDNTEKSGKPILASTKFSVPTIEEIKEYCFERKNLIDAEYFFNFYESKGWMVGKNKMKNWKSCIITWEKSNNQKVGNKQSEPEDKTDMFFANGEWRKKTPMQKYQ